MKRSRKLKGGWLAIGLTLILALLFASRITFKPISQVARDTVNPVLSPSPDVGMTATYIASLPRFPTPVDVELSATPVIPTATSSLAPPQCTFPLAQTTDEESTPKEYTISEPEVVLTDELQPEIIDWLPDNQNVLMMPSKLIDLGINGVRETIELFNPETKEIRIFATRRRFGEAPPVWNPSLNAIVYSDMHVLEGSTVTDFRFTLQVRISYGNPDDTKLLANNLPQYPIAVKPDGSQIAYFMGKELFKLDAELNALPPISFDRTRWDYLHRHADDTSSVEYRMAWRPNTSQIFLYNLAVDGLGYTYILDANTGQLCNLNFDGWALTASWSPNGRYLAIIRGQSYFPLKSTDLAIVDTATGKLYTLNVRQELEGNHLLKDIDWAPDNRHILTTYEISGQVSGMLFLSDFISGQIDRVLPSLKFIPISGAKNSAWSPDGSKILMNCPTSPDVAQVCLISVQITGE